MSRGLVRGLAVAVALVAYSTAPAVEPDGNVALRYLWPDKVDGHPGPPRLRL